MVTFEAAAEAVVPPAAGWPPDGPPDLPLTGVRVTDLTTGRLAAIGRHLAEWGADVVRVEPPGGAADRREGRSVGGVCLGFAAANLGKRALELSGDGDREVLDRLLSGADILLHSDLPGSARAVELALDGVRERHPALVVLLATGFGADGCYRDWQVTGPVLHALSGELARSGIDGRPPLLPPGDLPYDCAVAQAVLVVVLAYLERLRTGLGDQLDFSVLDGAVAALDPGYGIAGSATAGVPASRLPRGRPRAQHQYPIIACADGHVRLCVLSPRQWRGMFTWMGSPGEFADPSFDNIVVRFTSPALVPAIARFFADKKAAELEEAGQRHGVPTAALLGLDDALETEQVRARRAFVPVELAPGVHAPFPDGVVDLDGRRAGIRGPAPVLRTGLDDVAPTGDGPVAGDVPAGDPAARPLEGLRVLDLGVIVVGAEQGRLLADQGADVIKVESRAFPDGSRQTRDQAPMSVTFAAGHRNKTSIGLDLRSARGRELFLQLVEQTDVVLSNFRPGTLESLGLGREVLTAVNPGVVLLDSSAFGPTGPWSRRLGYGPLVRSSAGLTVQWAYPGEDDGFCDALTVYPDHVAARIGVAAALALLVRRRRTGRGGTVSVSQAEVMLGHMAAAVADRALQANGTEVAGRAEPDAPWGVFPTAGDDDWCVVTVRDDDDWQALCAVTGRADLAAEPALRDADGRAAARGRLDLALTDWLAGRGAPEAMELLQAAGVPAAAMLRVSELPTFPYFVERGLFRESGHPALGHVFPLENAPVRSGRLPDPPDRPAPLRGQHTLEVARDRLGLDETEIAALVADGVLEPADLEGQEQ